VRQCSRRSGAAASTPHGFDPAERELAELRTDGYARTWIALHGPGGEDGTVQGALEFLGIPYSGSGVTGSAIGMDKLRTKRLVRASAVDAGLRVLRQSADLDRRSPGWAAHDRQAASQGSSVGMTRVEQAANCPPPGAPPRSSSRWPSPNPGSREASTPWRS